MTFFLLILSESNFAGISDRQNFELSQASRASFNCINLLKTSMITDFFLQAGFEIEREVCVYLIDPLVSQFNSAFPSIAEAPLFENVSSFYQPAFHATKLPLMNPIHVFGLSLLYLLVVGAAILLMKPFNAFKITHVVVLHNVFLTVSLIVVNNFFQRICLLQLYGKLTRMPIHSPETPLIPQRRAGPWLS